MKLPRDIARKLLAKTLCRHWRYRKVHQSGSHIILETEEPCHQRIAIPDHDPLRTGTFNPILRAESAHKNVMREAILATLREWLRMRRTLGRDVQDPARTRVKKFYYALFSSIGVMPCLLPRDSTAAATRDSGESEQYASTRFE